MRKIIFRGFSKTENRWLYGDPAQCMYPFLESVGLNTGLKDSKGVEIYEGDILSFWREKGYVAYRDEKAMYVVNFRQGKYEKSLALICALKEPVVIGNVYENPELLEPGGE